MKKSYIVKNVMKAVNRYLVYGWDIEHIMAVKCDSNEGSGIKSLVGDIYYFHYYECEGLYPDFIIRFGTRTNAEALLDIDFLKVEKNAEGKVTGYRYMFCTPIKDLCLAEIVADTIISIEYMIK